MDAGLSIPIPKTLTGGQQMLLRIHTDHDEREAGFIHR